MLSINSHSVNLVILEGKKVIELEMQNVRFLDFENYYSFGCAIV